MKSTIMDNAKSDLIVVRMILEYYEVLRDKDIKRIACYHLNCCLKKIFIAIITNEDDRCYDELIKNDLNCLYKVVSDFHIPENISSNIKNISEWNESIIFVIDFRQKVEYIKQIYDAISLFFDNIFDINAVY